MDENHNGSSQNVSLEDILTNAITIPGVKVNRRQFLADTFAKENVSLQDVLDLGPIEAGCSRDQLKRIASSLVFTRTSYSSLASFAAGIPGGLAMAVTIPADVLQFFGMSLRLAQELTYLYGTKDLWDNNQIDDEAVRNELIMYLGVMFGVNGALAGVRLLSAQLAKTTLKKLPQKALTKTMWYPIVKNIGKAVGVKITKNTVAKGFSKAIPVIGGVISGGLNFASMLPMGNRLVSALDDAIFDYTEEEIIADYNIVSCISEDDSQESDEAASLSVPASNSDINNTGIGNVDNTQSEKVEKEVQEHSPDNHSNPFETLTKLAQLRDMGIITEEEFTATKARILADL